MYVTYVRNKYSMRDLFVTSSIR